MAAAASVLSFTVETLQYFVITGRDASLGDVVSNRPAACSGPRSSLGLALLRAPATCRTLLIAGRLIWVSLLAAVGLASGAGRQDLAPQRVAGRTTHRICIRSSGRSAGHAGRKAMPRKALHPTAARSRND